ncbi:MAG: pyridoxal phosphate-dependent aminotransferase [Treponema sp.]|nr:pyridoxal phosphate-dependent aminotransferase [Treponema sp.]
MPIATGTRDALGASSLIRRMFEEGAALKKEHGADGVFDFSLGNPDVDPPPAFRAVLEKFAREPGKGSHGYTPNAGLPFVREALAKKASREQKVPLDASHIVMSSGAAGGLNAVFKTICNPGDEIVVSRPYFVEYRPYAANHGARLVEVDSLPDFNLDLGAVAAALSPRTAAVLVNSPNNPTGRVYPAETLAALADLMRGHGERVSRMPYLVSDEPYREIVYGVEVPSALAAYDESIAVYSYSKSLSLPGERIGYVAVSPGIGDKDGVMEGLAYATRVLGFVNAPALMQRAVAELVDAEVDVGVYARRRDAFMAVLDGAGIDYAVPEGAFYVFCRVPPRKTASGERADDDAAFVSHLKRHLILGVPGSGFGRPGWLRFAFCVDEKTIRKSAAAFGRAMESW